MELPTNLPVISPKKRLSAIYHPTNSQYEDTKDPCVVWDEHRKIWHLYGSGGSWRTEEWTVLHATSLSLEGPWTEETISLIGLTPTPHMCAPGVIVDNTGFHMFIQTEFWGPQGRIYYLHSQDGQNFQHINTAIDSLPNTNQASMYDPHPAEIINSKGDKEYYLTFSAGPDTGTGNAVHGDIYIAKSMTNSWQGPWQRLGTILSHEEVSHHNQHDDQNYEWGLEGAQLIQVSQNKFLLNVVCFLPEGIRGSRQRVFFAIADSIAGPYHSLGTVLEPLNTYWESGENGHATGFIREKELYLYYQSRTLSPSKDWRYGLAIFDTNHILNI